MKKVLLLFSIISLNCHAQFQPLNYAADTTLLRNYIASFGGHTKNYPSTGGINSSIGKYIKTFSRTPNFWLLPSPLSEEKSILIRSASWQMRSSYLNNLNFGTNKDGSNNLSGTRFNRSYAEHSKRYD